MIVIDASALVELLIGGTPRAQQVGARVVVPGVTLHAPHLIDLEIACALRAMLASGAITAQAAAGAITDLVALALHRYPHDVLLPRIWQLRANLTAYDAAYVALAETLAVPLLTCDAALANAPGNHATIDLVP